MKTPGNIVAIIPARGGSKSIPEKNIIDFCGKPLIAWSIIQARESKYIQQVFVTTDNEKIGKVSREYGAFIIDRPEELASDASSSEDALLHAMSEIEKQHDFESVLFLQATSPLRESSDIDMAIEMFHSKKADSLFSASLYKDLCLWKDNANNMESITYDFRDRKRRQDRNPYYLENGSIYIFKTHIIKQDNNRLGGKIIHYDMPVWKSHEIDDVEDVEICSYYMQRVIKNKS